MAASQPPVADNQPPEQATQPPASDQRGTDQVPFTVKVLPAPDAKEQADKAEHAAKEKAVIDESIAFETQRIADYTDRLAWFTLLLFCAAAGQIVLFWVQLRYMRDGMRDAAIAANAAQLSAETARDSFTKLERPYVFLFGVGPLEHDGVGALAHFAVANYGKTPAIIENFRALASITPDEAETPIRVDDTHPLFRSPIISPGEKRDDLEQSVNIPHRTPPLGSAPMNETRPRFSSPSDTLFLWMVINYRGPFTKGHETSACWRYDRNANRFVQHGHDDYNYVK